MARKKTFWRGRKEAERRYRFRVRFTRPPGDGIWYSEKVSEWLDSKVGEDGWVMYPDEWEGRGIDVIAVHLDDHTVIPALLEFWQQQKLVPSYSPIFQASLGANAIGVIRSAIRELQQHLVDEINAVEQRVTWTLGECKLIPGVWEGALLMMQVNRVRSLGEVDSMLSAVPAAGGQLTFIIEDVQRGALETGVALLGDKKPPPTATIEDLRMLLDALDEIRRLGNS